MLSILTLPRDIAQYVHRAGRTGRMGANGTIISLVTEREERELKRYCRELNVHSSIKEFFIKEKS